MTSFPPFNRRSFVRSGSLAGFAAATFGPPLAADTPAPAASRRKLYTSASAGSRQLIEYQPFLDSSKFWAERGRWPAKWIAHPGADGRAAVVQAYRLSFSAAKWTPRASGLLGPVTLTPLQRSEAFSPSAVQVNEQKR